MQRRVAYPVGTSLPARPGAAGWEQRPIAGFATTWWQPDAGRWDLAWAHALLVGFFLSMAAGVCYHVLARWTGRRWRWFWPIRLHLLIVGVGLPLMLTALATGWSPLFAVAGPLQAVGVGLLLVNIARMLGGLPTLTRVAIALPATGARVRFAHAKLNLFGGTGLLICGVGYYLIPRVLGRPLRWPRLATAQVALLTAGALLGAASQWWRGYGGGSLELVASAHIVVAFGFALFGTLIALPVRAVPARGTVAGVQLRPGRGSNGTSGANAR